MFSQKSPEDRISFLKHDRVTLEMLLEGIIFKFTSTFSTWNVGLSFVDMGQNAHVHNQHFDEVSGGFKDLAIITDSKPLMFKNFHLRPVSLVDVTQNEQKYIARSTHPVGEIPEYDQTIGEFRPSAFEVYLKFTPDSKLYLSYMDEQGVLLQTFIDMRLRPMALRLFTWGPFSGSDITFSINSLISRNISSDSFRLGNIVVRNGDMFNSDPILNTNLTIIPTGKSGRVNVGFTQRLDDFHLANPGSGEAGSIHFKELPDDDKILLGFAYTMSLKGSSEAIIRKIVQQIATLNGSIVNDKEIDVRGISLPLLGTGSGGLAVDVVMDIYNLFFNAKGRNALAVVSIQSQDVFRQLQDRYYSEAVQLIHEFQNSKPLLLNELERNLNVEIPYKNFELDFAGRLSFLDLQNQKIRESDEILDDFRDLRSLVLNNTGISNLNFLGRLKKLRFLYLRSVPVNDFAVLKNLPNLVTLDLSDNFRPPMEIIAQLVPGIQRLALSKCELMECSFLRNLPDLVTLDLQFNGIYDISPVIYLKKLVSLTICHNRIFDVRPISKLRSLRFLDLSSNHIENFDIGKTLGHLAYLKVDQNPFSSGSELILDDKSNQLQAVMNFFLRREEKSRIAVRLPAKVLLMGNHGSGKSSLLRYIQDGKLAKSVNSTHIINIERYYETVTSGLPDAVFYDFGGQDYYHGIYRAFLSGGAINLVLWNPGNNENKIRKDIHGRSTQDFKLDYWLAQKRYLESEKESGQIAPVLLIQTHADYANKLCHMVDTDANGVINDFHVCLKNTLNPSAKRVQDVREKALKYLKSSILALIENFQVTREEPQWYIDFLVYVINAGKNSDFRPIAVKDLMKIYKRDISNKLKFLEEDLYQLYRQGLVLYYKDEMPDKVWLNPVALVNYVHGKVLNAQDMSSFNGKVPPRKFKNVDPDILRLLVMQKVIFWHEPSSEYIVPNFLELSHQTRGDMELYAFGLGDPIFSLKFLNFIPFGLINQIICFFGDLPHQKKFWRDRLIFTLDDKAKILININFQLLEIDVYASFVSGVLPSEQEQIKKYLFYGILGLYWDLDLLKYGDFVQYHSDAVMLEKYEENDPIFNKIKSTANFYDNANCRPLDLYISLNRLDYVKYQDLCSNTGSVMINSVPREKDGSLGDTGKPIVIFPFQPFSPNPLKRRKNVAISYSKKDLKMVNKFRDYLRPLFDEELINDPWFCTKLIAGEPWDAKIQQEFDGADIIFFMISENLMATKYVLENEVKNAIDRFNATADLMIVPIVLVPYRFQRPEPYNLGRFSSLPYTLRPVSTFSNKGVAWYVISECIRLMILNSYYPGSGDDLPPELSSYFERIIAENANDPVVVKSEVSPVDGDA